MKVILFGATGMVGQGVLRECLLDPSVDCILSVGRSSSGVDHPKFREIVHRDLMRYSDIEPQLVGFDACFFCLGVSSAGMKPEEYERITYGITLAAAETLSRLNSQMTFVYVSGAGTDTGRAPGTIRTAPRRTRRGSRNWRSSARGKASGRGSTSRTLRSQRSPP